MLIVGWLNSILIAIFVEFTLYNLNELSCLVVLSNWFLVIPDKICQFSRACRRVISPLVEVQNRARRCQKNIQFYENQSKAIPPKMCKLRQLTAAEQRCSAALQSILHLLGKPL